MKKLIAITAMLATSALALCACNPRPNPKDREAPAPRLIESGTQSAVPQGRTIETPSGRLSEGTTRPSYPGVRRRISFGSMVESGNYYIEYVHFPANEDRDESLDYHLELRDDNTFTFNVVTNNVSTTHEGHWYSKQGGNIILFYDEPMDETAHNVYVSDCMYCEYLPSGKIMIYDNCNVIVLAREELPQEQEPQDEPTLYQVKV